MKLYQKNVSVNRYSIKIIPKQPIQERLPSSHTSQLGELLKSQIFYNLAKLSEGSRASEFIQVFNLVWLSESYFGDQIRQRSENIDFQKFTYIIKNINIYNNRYQNA
ncbi:Hypothetical_protein [Hexamita inflata]|uniref:Hypothetical_protein n=1 Tax=Hexamita inflata TaxID=28002 RepID=A0AA86NLD4_9EUKA|nr:Hypothetical protein HINF_LOCUS8899 [Hexamita inflata]